MASLPHPIQYQGSKRNLASSILRFLPNQIGRLVEPFAGTAAISIAASAKGITQEFWLNDLNKPLIELLELIIENPSEIADKYTKIWNEQHENSIYHYFQVREEFNKTNDPQLFLYLLARCVKGAVRYNSNGIFNQSPDKRRKGTQPENMRKNIEGVSKLLKGKCKFTSLDFRDVLAEVKSNDFVYLDPPYQGVSGAKDSRYFSGIVFNDFVLALETLNRREISFAVSYDGKLGNKTFGQKLPEELGLKRIEIEVGRSSQATLLGREEVTVESLYLSRSFLKKPIFNIYLEEVDERELQIDHRVPFEVDSEPELEPDNFMLLCGSANRAKSWSCEHCENWRSIKDKSICLSCYWAYPENYTHIAMRQVRRIDIIWQGENVEIYERLKQQAASLNKEIPEFIKEIIEREIRQNIDD